MPLTDEQFVARLAEVFSDESKQPMSLWYLSFAGEDGFLGAIFVEARGLASAIARCNVLGINPHGEVRGLPLPLNEETNARAPVEVRETLLSKAELERLFGEVSKMSEFDCNT